MEELTQLSQLKDEELQKYQKNLEDCSNRLLELSNSQNPDNANHSHSLFKYWSERIRTIEKEKTDLCAKLAASRSECLDIKKRYDRLKAVCTPLSPQSPSGLQAENQALRTQISDLSNNLEYAEVEKDRLSQEIEKLQKTMETKDGVIKEMKVEAKSKFKILRQKLTDERALLKSSDAGKLYIELEETKKQHQSAVKELEEKIESLRKENQDLIANGRKTEEEKAQLASKLEELNEAARANTSREIGFIESMEEIFGCRDFQGALTKAHELSELPAKIALLESKLAAAGGDNNNNGHADTYVDVINALKQVESNLSPNVLNLPRDSELRQLFAALCNMIHAAIDPKASKTVLMPHVRSVVYQARVFGPKSEE